MNLNGMCKAIEQCQLCKNILYLVTNVTGIEHMASRSVVLLHLQTDKPPAISGLSS